MRILIWGTGNTAIDALNYLRMDIEVVAFVDSYVRNAEEDFLGKPVIKPEKINEYEWERLVICSIHQATIMDKARECGVEESKCLIWDKSMLCKVSRYKQDLFHNRLNRFKQKTDKIEMLITGISYHGEGLIEEVFSKNTVNFAMRSQDLFFDYAILEYIFANYKLNMLKYVIIGLSYYSFEYDYSKTQNSWEMIRYYPEIQKGHNLIEDACFEGWCMLEKREIQSAEKLEEVFSWKMRFHFSDAEGKKECAIYQQPHRPITVLENKLFLRKYIELLEHRKIQPIVVIMPVTNYYAKYCGDAVKNKFYKDLDEVLEGKEIQILDYFDKCDYSDDCFYNVSHLNKKGAELFTKRLDGDINW